MTIGFFSYADVGGMKLKNVAMVAIFTTASALMFWPVTKMKQAGGCSFDLAHLWLFPAVAITSLIFKLVDEKLADRGTPEETRSLVV